MVIGPRVIEGLEWARASILTPRGRVASSWHRAQGGFRLEVSIPGNSSALVRMPGGADSIIREGSTIVWKNGRFESGVKGVHAGRRDGSGVVFQTGSGQYAFSLSVR
jgi:alpha-L-rhamnosidase